MNSIDDAFDAPAGGIYAWTLVFAVVVFGEGRHEPFVRSIVVCWVRRGKRMVVVEVVLVVVVMVLYCLWRPPAQRRIVVGVVIIVGRIGIVASLVQRQLPWRQCPLVEELEGVFYSLLLVLPEEPPDLLVWLLLLLLIHNPQ